MAVLNPSVTTTGLTSMVAVGNLKRQPGALAQPAAAPPAPTSQESWSTS